MKETEVANSILQVKAWQKGEVRAPHKPLLMLYALAKFIAGQKQISFAEAEEDLRTLLCDFGPPRRVHRPEYPFWRLQNDKVWLVTAALPIEENRAGDVGRRVLIDSDAHGSFSKVVLYALNKEPALVKFLIKELLADNFPETIHEDILQAIGINLDELSKGIGHQTRCSKFRDKILRAYEYRCAVCGFDVRIGQTPIALEAAHIKWHQAGGPNAEGNGLALCTLHHKLFDRGAFTLSKDMEVCVSDKANGHYGFAEWLMQYHGDRIRFPQSTKYTPDVNYVSWHTNEVFQGNKRDFN